MYVDIVCELSFMLGFVSKHVYIILTLKVDQNTSNLQYTINYTVIELTWILIHNSHPLIFQFIDLSKVTTFLVYNLEFKFKAIKMSLTCNGIL